MDDRLINKALALYSRQQAQEIEAALPASFSPRFRQATLRLVIRAGQRYVDRVLFAGPSPNIKKELDWRVNSSSESLAAFRRALQDPYFLSEFRC